MKREVIAFGNYYNEFIKTLNDKEVFKLKYILSLLETTDRMPVKFIRYIRDGLYELRMEYDSNAYRIFFIFDRDYIVVLFNGFLKKTQKTPENEVNKALKIKEDYYGYKQSHDNKYK
jgi:phage-related protein